MRILRKLFKPGSNHNDKPFGDGLIYNMISAQAAATTLCDIVPRFFLDLKKNKYKPPLSREKGDRGGNVASIWNDLILQTFSLYWLLSDNPGAILSILCHPTKQRDLYRLLLEIYSSNEIPKSISKLSDFEISIYFTHKILNEMYQLANQGIIQGMGAHGVIKNETAEKRLIEALKINYKIYNSYQSDNIADKNETTLSPTPLLDLLYKEVNIVCKKIALHYMLAADTELFLKAMTRNAIKILNERGRSKAYIEKFVNRSSKAYEIIINANGPDELREKLDYWPFNLLIV